MAWESGFKREQTSPPLEELRLYGETHSLKQYFKKCVTKKGTLVSHYDFKSCSWPMEEKRHELRFMGERWCGLP